MEKWNFIFNIASALGSIGTFLTFLFLLFDKKQEHKKIKSKKELALAQLKFLKYELNELSKDIMFKKEVSTKIDELILDISEILGYKIIADDIRSSLSTLRYKILNISKNIRNNDLKKTQIDKLETTIFLLEKYVDIAIERLQ